MFGWKCCRVEDEQEMWRTGQGEAGAFLSSYCRNPLPCDYELRAFSALKKKPIIIYPKNVAQKVWDLESGLKLCHICMHEDEKLLSEVVGIRKKRQLQEAFQGNCRFGVS